MSVVNFSVFVMSIDFLSEDINSRILESYS